MKTHLLAAGTLLAALSLPLAASAQQQYQPPAGRAYGHSTTPSEGRLQRHWAKRFGNLNLSGDQQQRVQSLIDQYARTHPEGSPRDPGASRALRHQIMGVLNDDQRNQFRAQMRQRRAQMQQQRGQMQGGADRDQAPYDPRYGEGPQGQGYQQGPPPDQQYQPRDDQYPQGPPPDQQGPPPDQQGPPH